MLADISRFELLCQNGAQNSNVAPQVFKDIPVKNIHVSLMTLDKIAGNSDLDYLVKLLSKNKRLREAEASLDDVHITSIEELVNGMKKLMNVGTIPGSVPSEKTAPSVTAGGETKVVANPNIPSPRTPAKRVWRGPKLPIQVSPLAYDLPTKAPKQLWDEIEQALIWEKKRTKDKQDKQRCDATLRIVSYIKYMLERNKAGAA